MDKSAYKATGTRCMHATVDDRSRYATVSVFADEIAESVTQYLIGTYQENATSGIAMKRVLTADRNVSWTSHCCSFQLS